MKKNKKTTAAKSKKKTTKSKVVKKAKKSPAKKAAAKKTSGLRSAAKKIVAKMMPGNPRDIVELILRDHKPLKELIEALKDAKVSVSEKKPAFKKFAPLLLGHAQPEEKSLYVYMKDEDKDLRVEGYEGDTEHAIASQLVDEIEATTNTDEWMAKVKVLAEMVEHHITEEENDMLPDVRDKFDEATRIQIGDDYTLLREEFKAVSHDPAFRGEPVAEALSQ